MSGIRDILVRIRIRGSLPMTNGSGSDSSSVTLRIQKTIFPYFVVLKLTRRHNIFSLKFFLFFTKILLNLILQALFQSGQHLYEKREGSGAGSVPLTNVPGSERP